MEDERRNRVVAVQVVYSKYHYFVVAGRHQLFHAAFEPRAGPFEEDRPVFGRAQVEVRETVAVPSAQLPACLLLVSGQDADAQPRSFRQ